MSLEKGQTGKASETVVGDWIDVKSRNPNARKESPEIPDGFHFFDEVLAKGKGGNVLLLTHGSVAPNTVVKKVGHFGDS